MSTCAAVSSPAGRQAFCLCVTGVCLPCGSGRAGASRPRSGESGHGASLQPSTGGELCVGVLWSAFASAPPPQRGYSQVALTRGSGVTLCLKKSRAGCPRGGGRPWLGAVVGSYCCTSDSRGGRRRTTPRSAAVAPSLERSSGAPAKVTSGLCHPRGRLAG